MFPFLARYGSIFVYSFTVVLATGIILATLLTARLERTNPAPAWFDALLVVFVAAIIGGRFGFVVGHWDYFQDRQHEIWQIWRGGLSYQTALLAGLAALFLWAAATGRTFYTYAALFSPGLALVVVFGWLACWFDGCAYGRETIIGPLAADLPDKFGVFALRYQTQLIGILLALAAFVIILWLFKRLRPATLFWSALLLLSIAHLLPGLFRGDSMLWIGGLRLDLVVDGLLIIVSLLMLQYCRRN